jgi:hypothetical protein
MIDASTNSRRAFRSRAALLRSGRVFHLPTDSRTASTTCTWVRPHVRPRQVGVELPPGSLARNQEAAVPWYSQRGPRLLLARNPRCASICRWKISKSATGSIRSGCSATAWHRSSQMARRSSIVSASRACLAQPADPGEARRDGSNGRCRDWRRAALHAGPASFCDVSYRNAIRRSRRLRWFSMTPVPAGTGTHRRLTSGANRPLRPSSHPPVLRIRAGSTSASAWPASPSSLSSSASTSASR